MKYLTNLLSVAALVLGFVACNPAQTADSASDETCDYLDFRTPGSYQAAGIQMIEIDGGYKVWTKRFGNNPDMKVLLLHGGPAMTHEYLECFESFFPQANIEFTNTISLARIIPTNRAIPASGRLIVSWKK